ncbi:MAG: hypothetical protein IJQ73_07805 [Kiritimatiellae bacterium]|nr:hypothetical protein [Kiritimatiellia bacterium]
MKNGTHPNTRIPVAPVVTPLEAAPSGGDLPKRLKVLSWGENPNAHGKTVRVGAKLLRALSAPAYPYAKVAIDFEHNTVPGSREYERTREPRAIAGYAEVECVEGEGVFLNVTRWTPDGLAHARDYEDLSAAPVTDADGDVVALPSVALCRAGAVPGIEFVECPLSAALLEQGQGENMGTMDYKAILAKLLGLGPDAEDEAIQAALDALDADKAKKDDEAKAAQEALSARVEALEKGRVEDAKQRVILSARMEGKQVALSADALAKLSVEDVEKHVAALPVTVPLSALTPGIVKEPAKPSAIDEGIMRNLGLTEEDFK